jgi:hypothetical protein
MLRTSIKDKQQMLYNSSSMWPSVVVHEHWRKPTHDCRNGGLRVERAQNIDELRTAILQKWQQFPPKNGLGVLCEA